MVIAQSSSANLTPAALEERLVEFAVRVIKAAEQLSKNATGRVIAGQIVRSGTSPAPNYAEARSAESRADFVHKLAIVIKELNETAVWLRIIVKAGMMTARRLAGLQTECEELQRIIGASLRTAKQRAGSEDKQPLTLSK